MQITEIHLSKAMDIDQIQQLLTGMETQYKTHGPLNILAYVDSTAGYDTFSTYLKSLNMRSYFYTLIRKYAMITPIKWIRRIGSMTDTLTPGISLKVFSMNDSELAKEWLLSGDSAIKRNITLQYNQDKTITSFQVNDQLNERDFKFIDSILIEDYRNNLGTINLHLDFTSIDVEIVTSVLISLSELKHWQKIASIKYTFENKEYI